VSYSSEVLADSPLGYWRHDDASGFIQDSSGNARHSTAQFGVGSNTYAEAGAIASDPASKSIKYASIEQSIPDEAALDFTSTCSLEAWVKRNSTGANHPIMGKGSNGYYMDLADTANSFRLRVTKQDVQDLVHSTISITNDGQFHHVVFTRSGTTLNLYIDGVDRTGSVFSTVDFVATTTSLRLGGDSNGVNFMDGWLDEVAVYSTQLSAARVLAHYNAAASALKRGYKRLYGPAQLTASAADLYTVPTGARTRIRSVYMNNPSGSEREVTFSIGTDAAGTRFLDQYTLPAGEAKQGRRLTNHTLEAGEKIQGFADSAGVIVTTIDGFVESV
jgi:Concanavalin A-like lectin/glucanases superfamily